MGQRTDFDKLVLEVETDGSIALTKRCAVRRTSFDQYMGAFFALADIVDEEEGEIPSIFAPEGQESNAELEKQIEDSTCRSALQLLEARRHPFRAPAGRSIPRTIC